MELAKIILQHLATKVWTTHLGTYHNSSHQFHNHHSRNTRIEINLVKTICIETRIITSKSSGSHENIAGYYRKGNRWTDIVLLMGNGKVLNYFWGGCLHPPPLQKYFFALLKFNFKKKFLHTSVFKFETYEAEVQLQSPEKITLESLLV